MCLPRNIYSFHCYMTINSLAYSFPSHRISVNRWFRNIAPSTLCEFELNPDHYWCTSMNLSTHKHNCSLGVCLHTYLYVNTNTDTQHTGLMRPPRTWVQVDPVWCIINHHKQAYITFYFELLQWPVLLHAVSPSGLWCWQIIFDRGYSLRYSTSVATTK